MGIRFRVVLQSDPNLCSSLTKVCYCRQPQLSQHPHYSSCTRSALDWMGSVLKWMLCKLWMKAYSCIWRGLPASPEHWTKTIIQQLWKHSLCLWTYRNGVIHGHNKDDQLCLQSEQHQTQVCSYFMQYNQYPTIILAKDRHLFQRISMT